MKRLKKIQVFNSTTLWRHLNSDYAGAIMKTSGFFVGVFGKKEESGFIQNTCLPPVTFNFKN